MFFILGAGTLIEAKNNGWLGKKLSWQRIRLVVTICSSAGAGAYILLRGRKRLLLRVIGGLNRGVNPRIKPPSPLQLKVYGDKPSVVYNVETICRRCAYLY
jgi:NADH:ubiquinone oxidoreductase subunit F (NADH-binding)